MAPRTLRGAQLATETGRAPAIRRHAYNARVSLARHILDYAIGIQSPSVPLNATQQAQMQNDVLTSTATGSWFPFMTLDAARRVADINYAAQFLGLTPPADSRMNCLEFHAVLK